MGMGTRLLALIPGCQKNWLVYTACMYCTYNNYGHKPLKIMALVWTTREALEDLPRKFSSLLQL